MIKKECFEKEHIRTLQSKSHKDPSLIERTIYAFGLLEALVRVNLPFIFKGGTCLMLLSRYPNRLSTDIDIIVDPNINVDDFIEKASLIFPFKRKEEQRRIGKNNIVKRHFKFYYDSPIQNGEFYILLDILYEINNYEKVIKVPINNDLLLVDENMLYVMVPNPDCLLADKLTAFAPHTTGIPLDGKKDMEVMKQFYDVCTLIDLMNSCKMVRQTYLNVAKSEIEYRGNDITYKEALVDTINAGITIASRGSNKDKEYVHYVKGARDVKTHIFTENFSLEIASIRAPIIIYLACCILTDEEFAYVDDPTIYIKEKITNEKLMPLKSLRKANPLAYAYAIKADRLLVKYQISL